MTTSFQVPPRSLVCGGQCVVLLCCPGTPWFKATLKTRAQHVCVPPKALLADALPAWPVDVVSMVYRRYVRSELSSLRLDTPRSLSPDVWWCPVVCAGPRVCLCPRPVLGSRAPPSESGRRKEKERILQRLVSITGRCVDMAFRTMCCSLAQLNGLLWSKRV